MLLKRLVVVEENIKKGGWMDDYMSIHRYMNVEITVTKKEVIYNLDNINKIKNGVIETGLMKVYSN